MKVLKFIGRGVLAIFGLVVLLYLIVLAGNWNDQPPSAAALRMDAIIAARPQVPERENAIVYLLGFNVPAGQDPYEIGARRLAWIETYTDTTRLESDPLQEPIDLKSQGSPIVERIIKECGKDDRNACAEAFDGVTADWQPTEMETLALQRYRTLLGHRAWRDIVPLHMAAPLPAYGGVMHAQRLYHLSMLQLARLGKADAVRDGLNTELAYWRGAQRGAENLVAKMISVAAMRNHFLFSNLVLRRLPAERVTEAVPSEWQREFSADERSMHLVMAGEWKFSQGVLRSVLHAGDLVDTLAETDEPSTIGKWLDYLAKPMFKEQDTVNGIADRYLRFADQFAVPMSQYPVVKLELERYVRDHPQKISIYNPVGDYYLREVEGVTYADYAIRAANPEGMRRAALLVAQLRARGVAANAVAAEVARADLREPYSDAPFEWDAPRMAVVFTSPENHRWRRNEFLY